MTAFTETAHPRSADGTFAAKQHAESDVVLTLDQIDESPVPAHRTPDFLLTRELRDVADEFAYSEEEGAGMRALDIVRARAVTPHLSEDEFSKRWPEVMHLARMCEKYDTDSDDDISDMAYHADVTEHVVDIDDFRDFDGVDFLAFGKAMASEYSDRYWKASNDMAKAELAAEAAAPQATVVALPDRGDPVDAQTQARNTATRLAHQVETLEAQLAATEFGDEPEDVAHLAALRIEADAAYQRWQTLAPAEQVAVDHSGAA